jgi:hypothetical protein
LACLLWIFIKFKHCIITYIEDSIIYEELPDGRKKEIGIVKRKEPAIVPMKGMVLHGK